MRFRWLAAASAVGVLVGGCSGTTEGSLRPFDVPGAIKHVEAEPAGGGSAPRLTVRGYVVGEMVPAGAGAGMVLVAAVCESVSRADPPACEGRRLRIDNVPDVSSLQARVGALHQTASRCWSKTPLDVSGTLHREGAEVVLLPS